MIEKVRSMQEFKQKYFPERFEREENARLTPGELGKKLAQIQLEKLTHILRKTGGKGKNP